MPGRDEYSTYSHDRREKTHVDRWVRLVCAYSNAVVRLVVDVRRLAVTVHAHVISRVCRLSPRTGKPHRHRHRPGGAVDAFPLRLGRGRDRSLPQRRGEEQCFSRLRPCLRGWIMGWRLLALNRRRDACWRRIPTSLPTSGAFHSAEIG